MLWNRPARRLHDGAATVPGAEDLRDAYDRGRRDERAQRKRHPLMMTLLVMAALAGGAMLAVAAMEGSFGRGGEVVDRNLSAAADRAEPAVRDAAQETGAALREAGQSLRDETTPADGPG